jgi:hypothetical protein
MPATAGSVSVTCPACDAEISVELRFETLPRQTQGEPLRIDLKPDLQAIGRHVEQVHAD